MELLPYWQISQENRQRHRKNTQEAAFERLVAKAGIHKENALIREALPSDFGLTDWVTKAEGNLNEFNGWIEKKLPNITLVAIYGMAVLSSDLHTNVIRFEREGTTLGLFAFGKLLLPFVAIEMAKEVHFEHKVDKDWFISEGYFTEPFIYDPLERMGINLYRTSQGSDKIILYGYVVEPRGMTVIGDYK